MKKPAGRLGNPRSPSLGGWAVVGVVTGTLATILAFPPAQWLADAVQSATNEQVKLANARGTVWHGTAQLVLSGGLGSNDSVALPGLLEWRIRPQWGPVQVTLQAACCMSQALAVNISPAGWGGVRAQLSDHGSTWPSSLLAGLGTPWNTLQLEGQLALSLANLSLAWTNNRLALDGQLQLSAMQVSSRMSTLRPMGSYRVTLNGGASPTVQLETIEGSLELTGRGTWVGQRLQFEGVATAQPNRIEALSNLLNIIGRRDGARSLIKVGAL